MSPGLAWIARDLLRALGQAPPDVPRLIAITGSVAVGKSTFARALRRSLLRRLREAVACVSTDGFLRSEVELERAALLDRKGFPESYDRTQLDDFFAALRRREPGLCVPLYCHRRRGAAGALRVDSPRWVIIEGVYALQPAQASGLPCYSIFLEAEPAAIERWYVRRYLALQADPRASEAEQRARAAEIFERVNRANYRAHIEPLRARADLLLYKAGDHSLRSPRADTLAASHTRLLALLRARGAEAISHPGGTLLAHLQRTAARLQGWGAAASLVSAGLAHAAYGTQGFPRALFQLHERAAVRALFGDEAEAIVYAYCACDRAGGGVLRAQHYDRFLAQAWVPAEGLRRDLIALTVADELDVAEHGQPSADESRAIGELLVACGASVSRAAWAEIAAAPCTQGLAIGARSPEAAAR